MNKQRISQELSLSPFGNKGWMRSDYCNCPDCDKSDKFGILFLSDGAIVKCMRCGTSTSLFNYLKHINRTDLIEGFSAPIKDEIKSLTEEKEEIEREEVDVELPRGFKRVYYDEYLDERGFCEKQYNLFKIGKSTDMRLKNHLVFQIFQEGKLKTWLARSKKTKEWHKQNLKDYKEGKARLVLRYYNADDTEFSECLGGYDEITESTKAVIVVEGLTDKTSIDNKLNLYESEERKCVFTFGKNLSEAQISLFLKKGVENLILMYDPDALKEIEKFSLKYINKFKTIQCAKIEGEEDPGDLTKNEIKHIMNNLYTPMEFYFNNIKRIF